MPEIEPTDSLDGIGVEQRLRGAPPHDPRHSSEIGDRADLVVDGHHTDHPDRSAGVG